MFEESLPHCPICNNKLEWEPIRPSAGCVGGRVAPYCSKCSWFGSRVEAEYAKVDLMWGAGLRIVFSIALWVLTGFFASQMYMSAVINIVTFPVFCFPTFMFFWTKESRLEKRFMARMIETSENKFGGGKWPK